MPKYERAPKTVNDLANDIMVGCTEHKPLLDAKVKIDFVFAYADEDQDGNPRNFAVKHHGRRLFGQARIIKTKERVLGRGDAEILLDANWWGGVTEEKQRALLDHELTHLVVRTDKFGRFDFDDLHRPMLKLRLHDHEFGWFASIAKRHGADSIECEQAHRMMTEAGQFYWPGIVEKRK